MPRTVHGKAPSYLAQLGTKVNKVHGYNTRSSVSKYFTERANTIAKTTLKFLAKSLWNGLSADLTNIPNPTKFKNKLKEDFFTTCNHLEIVNIYTFRSLLNLKCNA